MKKKKLRILFPYVEAGVGHIMPMKSFADEFRKQHGDEFEIIECDFFKDSKDEDLLNYEKWFTQNVVRFAKHPKYGYFVNFWDKFFSVGVASWFMMDMTHHKAYKKSLELMNKLYKPDIVFSTHWATNYYAKHCDLNPITIMYCPDCEFNHVFSYPCDLALISTEVGYKKALKMKKRFNEDNLKIAPFLIRNEAFEISQDKFENRRLLGLPEDNFTLCFMEGGYGVGKMEPICKKLIKENKKFTVIACCGKNQKLYEEFKTLEVNPNVTFVPLPMTNDVLKYIAASDLFVGTGGNSIAEPTFFGHASIVSTTATTIEQQIARFYCEDVKSCQLCTNENKLYELIFKYIDNPELLKPYEENAKKDHARYGAPGCVEIVYKKIKELTKNK